MQCIARCCGIVYQGCGFLILTHTATTAWSQFPNFILLMFFIQYICVIEWSGYTLLSLETGSFTVLEHRTNTFVCLSKYVAYIHQSSFINVHTVTQNYSSYKVHIKSAINVYKVVANINVTVHISQQT